MRGHEPVKLARVELLRVLERLILGQRRYGTVGPHHHELTQVEAVIHSVVVELFFGDLILLVFECAVKPVNEIKNMDSACE